MLALSLAASGRRYLPKGRWVWRRAALRLRDVTPPSASGCRDLLAKHVWKSTSNCPYWFLAQKPPWRACFVCLLTRSLHWGDWIWNLKLIFCCLRAGTSMPKGVMLSLAAGPLTTLCFAPTAPGPQPDLLLLLHAAHQSIGEWTELWYIHPSSHADTHEQPAHGHLWHHFHRWVMPLLPQPPCQPASMLQPSLFTCIGCERSLPITGGCSLCWHLLLPYQAEDENG